MIVKNEEATIRATLESVRPYVGWWTISDTGSTDTTKEIIREVMAGIPGRLMDLPFVNFGHNRSEVLAYARGRSQWIICLDADMTIAIEDGFQPDPAYEALMIDFGWTGFENRLPLLIRGDLPWKSVGAVHEYTTLPNRLYTSQPTDKVRITSHGSNRNSPEKFRWHAALLEAELERDPGNARSTFYLAETYRHLGDPRALEMYRKRASMVGYDQETFYARYQAALAEPDWPTRQAELIATWESRPWRLEPLYSLLRGLNERSQHWAAYSLASAIEWPKDGPDRDVTFVHKDVWSWGIDFERSIAAWWVGRQDESRQLSLRLLQNPTLPSNVRDAVLRNLALTPEAIAS